MQSPVANVEKETKPKPVRKTKKSAAIKKKTTNRKTKPQKNATEPELKVHVLNAFLDYEFLFEKYGPQNPETP